MQSRNCKNPCNCHPAPASSAEERSRPNRYSKAAHSYLKLSIYRYVCDCLHRGQGRALEASIELELEGSSPRSPKFKDNPFHWALHGGVQRPGGIEIGKGAVLRYGRQLLYANHQDVPPHLFIVDQDEVAFLPLVEELAAIPLDGEPAIAFVCRVEAPDRGNPDTRRGQVAH